MKKNIIIIGSGLGGLSCACILQKSGFQVTVLEQQSVPGGCLQCFQRGGVRFETGMHFIGSAREGQTVNRLFRYFGIEDKVPLVPLDPERYDTVSLLGNRFEFACGREGFLEKMSSYFPKERDALVRYYDLVQQIAQSSRLSNFASANSQLSSVATEYQLRSINSVLDELFSDPLLKKVLVGNLSLYAAQLDKTPFSQHAFIMDFYNQSAFRVAGGSDKIASALISSFEQMGGSLLTRSKVVRIETDSERATGVLLSSGEFLPADVVLSTVHPARLMELLQDTHLLRPVFRARLSSLPQTTGCFCVYLKFRPGMMPYMNTNLYGYSTDSPWGCEEYTSLSWPKGFLYMHMAPESMDGFAQSGVIISYMKFDEVAGWQGTKVGHRGLAYEEFKTSRAERLLDEVERHAPGLRSRVEAYWTSTPLTYLDYTGTEGGSLYGVAKDLNLGAAGRVPYRTRIPNLFLAGQNVNSHGVLGVMVGTMVTCNAINEDK